MLQNASALGAPTGGCELRVERSCAQPAHCSWSASTRCGRPRHRALPAAGQAGRGQLLPDEMAGEGFSRSRPAELLAAQLSYYRVAGREPAVTGLQAGGGRGQPLAAQARLDTVAHGGHHRTSLWPWSLEGDCGFAVACEARINLSAAARHRLTLGPEWGPGRVSSDLFCQCRAPQPPSATCWSVTSACISSASVSPRPTPQEWAVCPCGLVDGWPQRASSPPGVSQWSPQSWI